ASEEKPAVEIKIEVKPTDDGACQILWLFQPPQPHPQAVLDRVNLEINASGDHKATFGLCRSLKSSSSSIAGAFGGRRRERDRRRRRGRGRKRRSTYCKRFRGLIFMPRNYAECISL